MTEIEYPARGIGIDASPHCTRGTADKCERHQCTHWYVSLSIVLLYLVVFGFNNIATLIPHFVLTNACVDHRHFCAKIKTKTAVPLGLHLSSSLYNDYVVCGAWQCNVLIRTLLAMQFTCWFVFNDIRVLGRQLRNSCGSNRKLVSCVLTAAFTGAAATLEGMCT